MRSSALNYFQSVARGTKDGTLKGMWGLSGAQLGILLANFLMWGGFFALMPLMSVHFVGHLGWAAASVGLVLSVRQLTQQGLTVFGGAWSDTIGPKPLILVGCLLRMLGFIALGWADSLGTLLAAGILAGVGGALFDAPKSAAVALVTPPKDRSRVFALMGTAGNLGMVTGPLLGSLLMAAGFKTAALLCGLVYAVVALVLGIALPHRKPESSSGGLTGLGVAVRDPIFLRFTLVLIGYYVMSTQLNVLVTLKAYSLVPREQGMQAAGVVYAVSAGLAVVLQFWLVQFLHKHVPERLALMGAVLLVGTGLGLMAFAQNLPQLLACVALFSLGSMSVFPTQQILTARMAPAALVGSYYGFSSISLGAGGAIGNFLGGALLDLGKKIGFADLPWLVLFFTGLLTALGLHWALRDLTKKYSESQIT